MKNKKKQFRTYPENIFENSFLNVTCQQFTWNKISSFIEEKNCCLFNRKLIAAAIGAMKI